MSAYCLHVIDSRELKGITKKSYKEINFNCYYNMRYILFFTVSLFKKQYETQQIVKKVAYCELLIKFICKLNIIAQVSCHVYRILVNYFLSCSWSSSFIREFSGFHGTLVIKQFDVSVVRTKFLIRIFCGGRLCKLFRLLLFMFLEFMPQNNEYFLLCCIFLICIAINGFFNRNGIFLPLLTFQ